MTDVYAAVQAERARQDEKWGGPEHDDTHEVEDWARWIGHRSVVLEVGAENERKELVQIAALAIAALESLDRMSPAIEALVIDDEAASTTPKRRLRECVEAWPDCYEGGYDPHCCRFPKSCSCTVYDEGAATEGMSTGTVERGPLCPNCSHPPHETGTINGLCSCACHDAGHADG